MASEDVIELGSSDEDAEPAPKRVKPRPNAMVHIPSKLTSMGKKPSKANVNPINKLIGKGVTVTKVNNTNQVSYNNRNGKSVKAGPILIKNQSGSSCQRTFLPIRTVGMTVKPLNVLKNITPQIIKVAGNQKGMRHPIIVQGNKAVTRLPPGVTITKTTANNKRHALTTLANVKKKKKVLPPSSEILTVDLDDDDIPETSTNNPQWYLRPEEQSSDQVSDICTDQNSELEAMNNAEPAPSNLIEITIEDSPIKSVQNKRTHEIGAELAITIDDSPVKSFAAKTASVDSDDEEVELSTKDKHSKKKLNYPKETDVISSGTIEIEIEPMVTEVYQESNSDERVEKNDEDNQTEDLVMGIVDTPVKKVQTPVTTPKKAGKDEQSKSTSDTIPESSTSGEFHPLYQEFIDLCFKLENSNDMQTIVEKKIKGYYRQVPKEYTESEEFIELVQSKLFAMKASPEKMYLYIKDIVDELNLQRKVAKSTPVVKETKNLEAERFQYGEESEFDSKRQRQIRKLEKTLKKLHRAIQKLEEQEVDFDDEEDSVYLLTERYKERMVRVHAKFCQLTNTKMPSEPRITIDPRPGQPAGPAKRLEKWVNKKVPIGKPLPFPDFHDVLRCVRDANEEDNLRWNDADVMEEARDLFTRCGKKLQRRRQENEWRLAASRISLEVDPAENSDDLKRKLENNKQLADKKETDVLNKFADKQNQLKLEPEEIGDKEAEDSPVETEEENDEEGVVEESFPLENKEKRKDRLRRLIQEKSKRSAEEKENKPKEDSNSKDGSEKVSVNEDSSEKQTDGPDNEAGSTQMEVELSIENENKECKEDDKDAEGTNDEELTSKQETHSISDDSNIDSDVDELHLLQKLHSDEFNSSTSHSSDSDSPIDISDTLSSGDNREKPGSDVISIENSSYSESETKDDDNSVKNSCDILQKNRLSGEIEYSSAGVQLNKVNNAKQYDNETCESILLASSDDSEDKNCEVADGCVNLKDDAISIGDTVIQKSNKENNELTEDGVPETESEKLKAININLAETLTKCAESDSVENVNSMNEVEQQKESSEKLKLADNTEVETCSLSKEVIENDSQMASHTDAPDLGVELKSSETNDVATSRDSDVNDNEVTNIENPNNGENLDKEMQDVSSAEKETCKNVTIDENKNDASQHGSDVIHEIDNVSPVTEELQTEQKEAKLAEEDSNVKDSSNSNNTDETKSLETMIEELKSDLAGNAFDNTT
ncbi:uncharacterized protein LOC126381315 isoform X2 [Pectinophora gossypiella]|nr:uncharacterized protein LOC126381315 isoform X2 [Pectinophora gossypiella]XP_049886780.1 uncharacterized protein LOC126381315 isoform X2 [Pectinophora gossypiella]